MGLDKEINEALASAFATTKLDVINESHLHAGHAGDDGMAGTCQFQYFCLLSIGSWSHFVVGDPEQSDLSVDLGDMG